MASKHLYKKNKYEKHDIAENEDPMSNFFREQKEKYDLQAKYAMYGIIISCMVLVAFFVLAACIR